VVTKGALLEHRGQADTERRCWHYPLKGRGSVVSITKLTSRGALPCGPSFPDLDILYSQMTLEEEGGGTLSSDALSLSPN
jgi:hypothetical protein